LLASSLGQMCPGSCTGLSARFAGLSARQVWTFEVKPNFSPGGENEEMCLLSCANSPFHSPRQKTASHKLPCSYTRKPPTIARSKTKRERPWVRTGAGIIELDSCEGVPKREVKECDWH
jgi:hypothetical protein